MNKRLSSNKAVFSFEWKQLVRSQSFLWLTALVLSIGCYAVLYGKSQVSDQQRKISLLEQSIDSLYKVVADSMLHRDTTASFAGEFLGRLHANRPDGIAALAFGQRDIHKFAQHITNGSFFYDKYASGYVNKTLSGEIVNPFKLLSGKLDLSFVFLFLFPLYLILLSYNCYSSEVEGGTIGLLAMQPKPVSGIITSRILLRYLLILGAGLLLIATAGIGNAVLTDIRLWWFALAFAAYLFCWAGIISLVVSLRKSSGLSALTLVSLWIGLPLLIPALLNGLINTVMPVSTKTELSSAVQKANAEVWALPKPVRVDSFKKLRPYYAAAFDTIGSWEDPKFYRVTHFLIDNYISRFEQTRVRHVAERNKFADRLNYISPSLITQSIFNELSGSDMQQLLAYDTSAYEYFKSIMRYTDNRIFLKNDRIDLQGIREMPQQFFSPDIQYGVIAGKTALLVIAGLLGFWLGYKKYK